LELLVVHFIEEINREQSKDVEGLDNEALALLKAHTWPGNVREFRNVIEQAVMMREHGQLTPRDLPDEIYKERHKPASLRCTSSRLCERRSVNLPRSRSTRTTGIVREQRWERLDHVVVFNERHLRHALSLYVDNYHRTRTYLSLDKDCPDPRFIQPSRSGGVVVITASRGLHHRYSAPCGLTAPTTACHCLRDGRYRTVCESSY
jgi:DNA-binding NtrC family response regulator